MMTAVLVLAATVAAGGTDWTAEAERVRRSIVEVESAKGRCTGFVIHANQKDHDGRSVDLVLTAAHCNGANVYADRTPAVVLHLDPKKDLMVLQVEDTDRPALVLARHGPKIGEEVGSYGYGYGLERPMLRVTHVADTETYIPENGGGGPFVCTDAAFVDGQSGAPVINAAGEVVMIVQRGTNLVGLGVDAEAIRDRVGKYFELKAK